MNLTVVLMLGMLRDPGDSPPRGHRIDLRCGLQSCWAVEMMIVDHTVWSTGGEDV